MAQPQHSDHIQQEPHFGEEPAPDKRSISVVLRRAREKHGQDLRRVAQALRIRYAYLEAIERGDFGRLPGPAYAVGFVRTYAEFLGLDGDRIVDGFKREVAGLKNQSKLHFPAPAPESKIPSGAVFMVCAVVGILAYGTWYYLSNRDQSVESLIQEVPARLQSLLGGEASNGTAGDAAQASSEPVAAASEPVIDTPAESSSESLAETLPAGDELAGTPESPDASVPEPAPEGTGLLSVEDLAAELAVAEDASALPPAPATEEATTEEAASIESAESSPVAEAVAPLEPGSALSNDPGNEALPTESLTEPERAQVAAAPAAPLQSVAEAAQELIAEAVPEPEAAPESAPESAPAAAPASDPAPEISTEQTATETAAIPSAPAAEAQPALVDGRQPVVYGETNTDARIVLRATQDSWIQVRDGSGSLILTRVLRNGDTYRVANQENMTLLTGNAGGLIIEVDGKSLPLLGPVGAVRRNVQLDPERLQNGTALSQ